MQGVGNWVNTAIILICLAAWNLYSKPYNPNHLQAVWRLSTGLGLLPVIFMLFWRIFKLKESSIWKVIKVCILPTKITSPFQFRIHQRIFHDAITLRPTIYTLVQHQLNACRVHIAAMNSYSQIW